MFHTRLNFINRSKDSNDSQILLFQKNEAMPGAAAVSWRVIADCKPGQSASFKFSRDLTIAASDSYGTFTEQQPAANRQRFTLTKDATGTKVLTADDSGHPRSISFVNDLEKDPANVNLYRNGRLVAIAAGVASGREVAFGLSDSLWIGAVTLVEEGVILHPAIIDSIRQKLILTNIASADLVMSGGGVGPGAKPFEFALENVVYA
ncbi:MAG: hypothetical protein ABW019_12400 [Chitinophagaceae bacterium]